MKIEIWSDIMCPFCYIGKRNFEKALGLLAERDKVEVEWKSFQLDPTIPENPSVTNAYEYLALAKGISLADSKAMHENVILSAKHIGLTYNYEKAIVANSFNAHRLIQLAKTKSLGDQAEEALFKAYFTEGKNINDTATLIGIGCNIGLACDAVSNMLASNEMASAVNSDIQESREIGVKGVPFFVIDRKYAVSGAQPVEVFVETLEKAMAQSVK